MANSLDKWFDVQSKKIDEAEKKIKRPKENS